MPTTRSGGAGAAEEKEAETTNTNNKGLEGLRREHELQESRGEEKARWSTQPYTLRPDWRGYDSQPCLPRRDDGIPSRLDANWRNRKERIVAKQIGEKSKFFRAIFFQVNISISDLALEIFKLIAAIFE